MIAEDPTAGHFQRWANRFLESCGAKGDRQSFHSSRHSFTDALRRASGTGEVMDALCGWTRGDMREMYGSEASHHDDGRRDGAG